MSKKWAQISQQGLGMSFIFTRAEFLCLLPLPWLLLWWRGTSALPISDLADLSAAQLDRLSHPVHYWRWSVIFAVELLILASAGPLLIRQSEQQETQAFDLLLVLDVSGSMQAIDWPEKLAIPEVFPSEGLPPERLQTAKRSIVQLLENNPTQRVGLLAFAKQSFLICPLMRGSELLKARLESLQSDDFSDGTALATAIQHGLRALPASKNTARRIMILFSDGADHGEISPLSAAEEAAAQGVVIFTVGIGGSRAYHAVNTESGRRWEAVGEQLDEETLRGIAQSSGAAYYHAADTEQLLEAIQRLTKDIAKHGLTRSKQIQQPLTKKLLLAAMLLLVAAAAFRYRTPLLQFS
jgi:Ca-activated chloride channel family protein